MYIYIYYLLCISNIYIDIYCESRNRFLGLFLERKEMRKNDKNKKYVYIYIYITASGMLGYWLNVATTVTWTSHRNGGKSSVNSAHRM